MKSFFYKASIILTIAVLSSQYSLLTASKATPASKQKAPTAFINRSKVMLEAKKVNREKYPDADSVLVWDVQKITYQADGSSVEFDEFYQKILTEKGKRGAGVFREYFNISYGKVQIWAIEIIKSDGKVIKIDLAKNSKLMISPGQMGSNIYNPNSKILSVTVPGVEIGDTMHYFVQRSTFTPRMKNIWTDMYVLQSTTPVIYYNIVVNGPKSRPLKKHIVKNKVKDSVSFNKKEVGDRIIYNWTFRDIPRIFPEPKMPAYYMHAQRLLLSTAQSWSEISKWYNKLCAPHLKKVTPAMKKKVVELTKGLKSDQEKIEAIFRFVSTKIRYMGLTIETTAPGYEPHDINITFKNRYGVCRDKAALLSGMLRLAGIKSYPVLIMAGTKKDKEVPNNIFNHAITCAITKAGKTVLMDSTDETTKDILPAYLSDKSYLPAKPSGSNLLTSPIVPASDNLLQADTNGELLKDGSLTASTKLMFNGINDTMYRGAFLRWKPERIKQFFASRLKSLMPGAKLNNFKITPQNLRNFKTPLSVEFSFSTNSLLIQGKNAMLMQIPKIGSSFSAVNWVLGNMGLNKRKYPLQLSSTCGVVENFKYKLPLGLVIAKFPEYKEINWNKFTWKRKIKNSKGQLSGTSKYLINAVEFLPNEYIKLKKNIETIQFQNRKMLVLKKDFAKVKDLKNLFPTAQSLIINQNSEVNIKDKNSFTIKTRIKKKILSYAGVKNNSEIKFHYNPAWQKVSINSVVITNPNGKKFKLNKTETNIMDQSWIGSAPRYPAGKIMVVSLPGVQIGSLIEYEIIIKNSKQPFVSTMALFQNNSPIINKKTVLTYPKKMKLKISKSAESLNVSSSKKDGKIIQKWQTANVAAIPAETQTPPAWMFVPTIKFSNGNWKTYSKELKEHIEKAAQGQKKTEALASKLTAGKAPLEAMQTIRDYVAQKIRAAGPGLSAFPLSSISNADTTLTDAYGNSTDRAVLLYTMLKKAGFKAELLAVANTSAVAQALADLNAYPDNDFDTVLVKIIHEGKSYFFNDTNQYAKLGSCANEGNIALNLNSSKLEIIKTQKDMINRLDMEYSLKIINDGSILISSTTYYYGDNFESKNRLFSEISPEERKRHFQKAVSSIAQSAVPITKYTSDFKTYPGKVHYAVKVPDYVVKDGKYLYFKLPFNYLKHLIRTGLEKRENPYLQGEYDRVRIKYFIDLPDKLKKIVIQPENFFIKYPQNGGTISISSKKVSPKRLEIIYNIDLKPCIVPANEYGFLVNAQTALSKPDRGTIMLVIK
jgi:transglutaminase-like putative cysteine protease